MLIKNWDGNQNKTSLWILLLLFQNEGVLIYKDGCSLFVMHVGRKINLANPVSLVFQLFIMLYDKTCSEILKIWQDIFWVLVFFIFSVFFIFILHIHISKKTSHQTIKYVWFDQLQLFTWVRAYVFCDHQQVLIGCPSLQVLHVIIILLFFFHCC